MPTRMPRRPATLKDIANKTGFSISTVSRALANNPMIPEPTRTLVQAAATELQYRPNVQAQALRKQRSMTIGVVLPDVLHPHFAQLAASLQRSAQAHGYTILLNHTDEQAELLNTSLSLLSSYQVDGMIVVPHINSHETIETIAEQGIPIVAVDRTAGPNIPAVTSAPEASIKGALAHFAQILDGRIGYLANPQDTATGQQRHQAVLQAAKELQLDIEIAQGGYQQQHGNKAAAALLQRNVNCLLAGDLQMTIGAMEYLREQGLTIGADVALIGFDDCPLFQLYNPGIATIDQHPEQLAQLALEMLLQLIAGETPPSTTQRVPTTLRLRPSASLSTRFP